MANGDAMPDELRGSAPVMSAYAALQELRGDVKKVVETVGDIKLAQAVVAEHLKGAEDKERILVDRMLGVQKGMNARLEKHDDKLDGLEGFRNEARGVVNLAKFAMGTSLLGTAAFIFELIRASGAH